jgi:hypothetical protein
MPTPSASPYQATFLSADAKIQGNYQSSPRMNLFWGSEQVYYALNRGRGSCYLGLELGCSVWEAIWAPHQQRCSL